MKKIVCIIISLIIVFAFSACTSNKPDSVSTTNTVDVSEPSFTEVILALRNDEKINDYYVIDGYVYQGSIPIGSIHTFGIDLMGNTVFRNDYFEVVFDNDTDTICLYSNGIVKSLHLPDADYCGVSQNSNSIICRCKNNVYAIDCNNLKSELIATNVSQVITCQYPIDSEIDTALAVYCPLFLMNDGSLKAFIYDELKTPLYEGGYIQLRPHY